MNKFTLSTCEKLGFYVYRLIDPRNGNTFYVGKGKENRVFAHAKAALANFEGQNYEITEEGIKEDDEITKMDIVRDILAKGLDVTYIIHRHGMEEETALEVEASLIDAYSCYNAISGYGSIARGSMAPSQLEELYGTEEIASFDDNCMIIKITEQSIGNQNGNIYEAVRKALRANKERAEKADYILASKYGLVVGVFTAKKWLSDEDSGRIYFEGCDADYKGKNKYINKRLPDKYMRTLSGGSIQNPIRYTY